MRPKVGILLFAILGAAGFVWATLADDEKPFGLDEDDPLHQRMVEDGEALSEHGRAITEALAHARKTGDYIALAEAAQAYAKISDRYEPSKLDFWEARQRLIDDIHESDDETVYSWYFLIQESIRSEDEMERGFEELMSKIRRIEQNREAEGVSLIPAPQR